MAYRHLVKKISRLAVVCVLGFTLMGATCSEIYTRTGTWYRVSRGDTLSGIANRFGSTVQYIAEINNITDAKQLKVGERIYIPSERRHYAAKSSGKKGGGKSKSRPKAVSDKIVVEHGRFDWPVAGALSSGYGFRNGRRHDGIDISAPRGTPVHAAASGEVSYSSRLRGYGNLILIKHPEGFYTVYAHNSRNLAKKGQKVKRGQVIARVGSTGRATGPHVHFEVRKGSKARNPLFFLPKENTRVAKK